MPGLAFACVGVATVRHEVGTVSAHMRDDSVASVTPGGPSRPPGGTWGVHDVSDTLGGAVLRLAWQSACLVVALHRG